MGGRNSQEDRDLAGPDAPEAMGSLHGQQSEAPARLPLEPRHLGEDEGRVGLVVEGPDTAPGGPVRADDPREELHAAGSRHLDAGQHRPGPQGGPGELEGQDQPPE